MLGKVIKGNWILSPKIKCLNETHRFVEHLQFASLARIQILTIVAPIFTKIERTNEAIVICSSLWSRKDSSIQRCYCSLRSFLQDSHLLNFVQNKTICCSWRPLLEACTILKELPTPLMWMKLLVSPSTNTTRKR